MPYSDSFKDFFHCLSPMLAVSNAFNSSTNIAYNRSGQAVVPFRSEPIQRVVPNSTTDSGDERTTADTVDLSQEGLARSRSVNGSADADASKEEDTAESGQQQGAQKPSTGPQDLTVEEQQMVTELKQRDMEVKAHEMAHLAVAGQYARGGASYTYQQGPDGRRYAVGGEVSIDMGAEKTPEETIQKMRAVRRAAMAPAEPSSTDRSVAANAAALESRARQELQAEETEEAKAAQEQSAASESEATPGESGAETAAPLESQHAPRSIDVVA
jgi:hypothetical protein